MIDRSVLNSQPTIRNHFIHDGLKETFKDRNVSINLINIELQTKFETCVLRDCSFEEIKFKDADFKSCKFKDCKFIRCTFDKGVLSYLSFPEETIFEDCTFNHIEFESINFTGFLSDLKFNGCNIKEGFFAGGANKITFNKTYITMSSFSGPVITELEIKNKCTLVDTSFKNIAVREFKMENSEFAKLSLDTSMFDEITFESSKYRYFYISSVTILNAYIKNSSIVNCEINTPNNPFELGRFDLKGQCNLTGLEMVNYNFSGKNLNRSVFTNCEFEGANFQNCELESVKFKSCNLINTDFRYSELDTKVEFDNVIATGAHIELYQLKKLKNYGGLTESQIGEMNIEDGLTDLKTNFTGFLQWLHIISIIAFVAPYAAYLVRLGVKSKFFTNNDPNDPTIFSTFVNFVYSGGKMNWEISWTFLAFCVLLIYNIFRGLLLFKTKKMELYESAIGIPKRFSLDEKVEVYKWKPFTYKWLYKVVKYGVYANIILVLFHVIMFLQRPVHL